MTEKSAIKYDHIEIITEGQKNLKVGPDKNKELTKAERQKIAIEECNLEPLETIGHAALLKTANFAIETGATNAEFSTKATFSGKRYALKMKITWEQIDE